MSLRGNAVRIGQRHIDEQALLAHIADVQAKIESWARRYEVWHDCGFAVPYVFYGDLPRGYEAILLCTERFDRFMQGEIETSFHALLDSLGYWYERNDHTTMALYPEDEHVCDELLSLQRWQWLQKLSERKLLALHSEVFEYFAKRPESMTKLGWRQFEELLDAIFKNQGFQTELGPGTSDGGVDIRLYQDRAVPEVVTLVQAKRYADRPIGLEPVAALFGIASVQNAPMPCSLRPQIFNPQRRPLRSALSAR
jgi:restriction system protein